MAQAVCSLVCYSDANSSCYGGYIVEHGNMVAVVREQGFLKLDVAGTTCCKMCA